MRSLSSAFFFSPSSSSSSSYVSSSHPPKPLRFSGAFTAKQIAPSLFCGTRAEFPAPSYGRPSPATPVRRLSSAPLSVSLHLPTALDSDFLGFRWTGCSPSSHRAVPASRHPQLAFGSFSWHSSSSAKRGSEGLSKLTFGCFSGVWRPREGRTTVGLYADTIHQIPSGFPATSCPPLPRVLVHRPSHQQPPLTYWLSTSPSPPPPLYRQALP